MVQNIYDMLSLRLFDKARRKAAPDVGKMGDCENLPLEIRTK